MSPNQGQVWNLMAGGVGNPLIVDDSAPGTNVNPVNGPTPNGAQGRIVLAVPTPTGNAAQDAVYEGWLYATVATPAGALFGIFVTKDFGQNWTQVRIPTLPPDQRRHRVQPGDPHQRRQPARLPDHRVGPVPAGQLQHHHGRRPDQPQHHLRGRDRRRQPDRPDPHRPHRRSGMPTPWSPTPTRPTTAARSTSTPPAPTTHRRSRRVGVFPGSYLNFIRNPQNPFLGDATLDVFNYASFTNNGAGVEWIPFDAGGTDYHRVTTMIDPTTGLPRLIFGNDQGIWSVLDNNGTFETQIGISYSTGRRRPQRQPPDHPVLLRGGAAQQRGRPDRRRPVLRQCPGQRRARLGPRSGQQRQHHLERPRRRRRRRGHQPARQRHGLPVLLAVLRRRFHRLLPGHGPERHGQLRRPDLRPAPGQRRPAHARPAVAVHRRRQLRRQPGQRPRRRHQLGASAGSSPPPTQGVTWFDIGDPASSAARAASASPWPTAPPIPTRPRASATWATSSTSAPRPARSTSPRTAAAAARATTGSTSRWAWTAPPIQSDHHRSRPAAATTPTPSPPPASSTSRTRSSWATTPPTRPPWVNITSNLHNLAYSIFGQSYNPTTDPNSIKYNQARPALTSIVADWRYAIPNSAANPGPGYHPVLYVGRQFGRVPVARQRQDLDALPHHDLRRRGGWRATCPMSPSARSASRWATSTPTRACPTLAGPYDPSNPGAAADPDLLMAATYGRGRIRHQPGAAGLPQLGHASTNASGTDRRWQPDRDRPGDLRRPQRDHRLRQRHLDHDRGRDRPGQPDHHRRLRPLQSGPDAGGEQLDRRPGQFRHHDRLGDHPQLPQRQEDDRDLRHRRRGGRGQQGDAHLTLNDSRLPQPPPTTPPTFSENLAMSPADIKKTIIVNGQTIVATTNTQPTFIGVTNPGVTLTVFEKDANGRPASARRSPRRAIPPRVRSASRSRTRAARWGPSRSTSWRSTRSTPAWARPRATTSPSRSSPTRSPAR